jgi:hypothetical protein
LEGRKRRERKRKADKTKDFIYLGIEELHVKQLQNA